MHSTILDGPVGRMRAASAVPFVLALLAADCGHPPPAELDQAGAAVVRHLVERNIGAYPEAPWEVVCLGRRDEFRGESEEAFLRRFEGERPPVVPTARCGPAEDDSRWIVEGTGEAGLEIQLRTAGRVRDGRLRIEALASGAPIDFSIYECTLVRENGSWRVEECVATIMT